MQRSNSDLLARVTKSRLVWDDPQISIISTITVFMLINASMQENSHSSAFLNAATDKLNQKTTQNFSLHSIY